LWSDGSENTIIYDHIAHWGIDHLLRRSSSRWERRYSVPLQLTPTHRGLTLEVLQCIGAGQKQVVFNTFYLSYILTNSAYFFKSETAPTIVRSNGSSSGCVLDPRCLSQLSVHRVHQYSCIVYYTNRQFIQRWMPRVRQFCPCLIDSLPHLSHSSYSTFLLNR